ncbi:hypothetical protein AVEN_13376-1 [Araneus ventricosus]|uniref:Uncharacterized protein n=1 Tax=Araneus ventricosus TaxID=182803 RepID=A0A4Y2R136_ARAVE|nr:hypothetical protein AVEN_149438-1 [Araneus ventricosus]GBN69401.1 hypothetical protein AVEN_13376-1 [Araneus ventricosus]
MVVMSQNDGNDKRRKNSRLFVMYQDDDKDNCRKRSWLKNVVKFQWSSRFSECLDAKKQVQSIKKEKAKKVLRIYYCNKAHIVINSHLKIEKCLKLNHSKTLPSTVEERTVDVPTVVSSGEVISITNPKKNN